VTSSLLFIDESGNERVEADWLVVAGVLVEPQDRDSFQGAVREALGRLMPGLGYPPHASVQGSPAGRLAFTWLNERDAAAQSLELRALLEETRRLSSCPLPRRVQAFFDALARGREPDYVTEMGPCNDWLRSSRPRLHEQWQQFVDRDREGMVRLLQRLQESSSLAVVAAAAQVGDLNFDEPGPSGFAYGLYLTLLEVLLERAVALLRAPAPPHQIWTTVAVRDVPRWAYPEVRLVPGDLGRAIHEASQFPLLRAAPLHSSTRLLPERIVKYDERVPAGVVLADFVANRLRRVLKGLPPGAGAWNDVEREVRQTLGLPLLLQPRAIPEAGRLPTVATIDPARQAILLAFTGPAATGPAPVLAVPPLRRQWQLDQAERWMDAGRRWTATEAR